MKKLMVLLAVVALIVGFGIMRAEAANTVDITVTVTLQDISVTVSPDAWNMGIVAPSDTKDNTGAPSIATNGGNVDEDLVIKGNNSTAWSLGDGTVGADEFAVWFQDDDDTGITTLLTSSNQPLIADLAPSGTFTINLKFQAPVSSTSTDMQTILVNVTASAS